MNKWLSSLGRAALIGGVWGAAWVPFGVVVGTLIVGEMEPEWMAGPLYAGFLCGAIFSGVAGIAKGHHRLAGMTLPVAGVRGAFSGFLTGVLWLVVVLLSDPPKWLLDAAVVGALTVLSGASGVASALVARMGKSGVAHVA